MPSTRPRVSKTLFVTLFSALVIAAGLITSCNKQGPSPSGTPALAPEGETIIVIKGGSVEVGFDDHRYVAGINPRLHECTSCKFIALEVGPDEYNLTPCPISDQKSKIHIKAGGPQKDININGKPGAASGIVIEFDPNEYGPDAPSGKKHYNGTNHLDDVKVTPQLCCACPDEGNCYIRIRTSY